MTTKDRSRRGRSRDEHEEGRPSRSAAPGSKSENLTDRVLSMQRDYGNAAVATVVQRKDRPASTDAPGYKPAKKGKPAPPAPKAEEYAPTKPNPKFADWTDSALSERAGSELEQNVKNSWYFAADLYEELWFRHQNRAYAMGPYRAYKKLGDEKRTAFWLGVTQGTIKPGAPVQESQAGKEF